MGFGIIINIISITQILHLLMVGSKWSQLRESSINDTEEWIKKDTGNNVKISKSLNLCDVWVQIRVRVRVIQYLPDGYLTLKNLTFIVRPLDWSKCSDDVQCLLTEFLIRKSQSYGFIFDFCSMVEKLNIYRWYSADYSFSIADSS